MSLLKTAANAAAGLALLGLATVGAAALSGVGHRWVDILAQFTAPALLAASGVTLACLILRLWPAAGAGVASVLVLAIAVWPQWAPSQGHAAPGQPVVRLYSANLWVENTDVAAMKRSIAAADADILVLIEVGDAASDRLDDLLAGYPHRAVMGAAEAPGGRALSVVASRYPILRRLPASRDGLSAVGAVVETPLGPINVLACT